MFVLPGVEVHNFRLLKGVDPDIPLKYGLVPLFYRFLQKMVTAVRVFKQLVKRADIFSTEFFSVYKF